MNANDLIERYFSRLSVYQQSNVFKLSKDYKNLPGLCTGTGKSTRVSKICSPRLGLPSRRRCKSLTRGLNFLSLYKVVVDYFSPTTLNPNNKKPFFCFQKLLGNVFCLENGTNVAYDVIFQQKFNSRFI